MKRKKKKPLHELSPSRCVGADYGKNANGFPWANKRVSAPLTTLRCVYRSWGVVYYCTCTKSSIKPFEALEESVYDLINCIQ